MNIYIISDEYKEEDFKIKTGEKDITFFWKVYHQKRENQKKIFTEFEKRLAQIRKDSKENFNELFILQVKNQEDKLIKSLFENLNKIIKETENYNIPFIFFLVDDVSNEKITIKKPEEEEYERFSQTKMYTFPFKQDEKIKIKFKNLLYRCCSYYNELGDLFQIFGVPYNLSFAETFPVYINILLIGRSGAGKSTFINRVIGDYLAKEGGTSYSTSKKITKYHLHNKPIRFIDSPGFEDEKTSKNVIRRLDELDNNFQKEKDQIHLILYFIDGSSENKFLNIERDVLDCLTKNPKPILFIASHTNNDPCNIKLKKKYNNELRKIKDALLKILGEENYKKLLGEEPKNEKEEKIILVNFKKSDLGPTTIKPFGIDKIFNRLFSYLDSASKILEAAQMLIKDSEKKGYNGDDGYLEKHLKAILKDNIFFQNIQSFDDLEEKYEKAARSVIRWQTFKAGTTGTIPIIDISSHYYIKKSLKKQIAAIYGFDIEKEEEEKKKKINEKNKLKYTDNIEELDKEIEKTKKKNEKAEKEINQNTQSSYGNAGKVGLGIVCGEAGLYLESTAMTALRYTGAQLLMGLQIVIGSVYGGYKMYSNGEEILEIYKKKFHEKKYESLVNFIQAFKDAIEYLEKIANGFSQLYKNNSGNEENDDDDIFLIKKILGESNVIAKNDNDSNPETNFSDYVIN